MEKGVGEVGQRLEQRNLGLNDKPPTELKNGQLALL